MAIPPQSHQGKPEYSSTYLVQDRSNEQELIRVDEQDRMATALMGVMVEQKDPASFERVLDVGCGAGWWLMEAARTYPSIASLVGVDISERIVSYARAQAQAAQLSDRVQFQVGDALRMLEFPTSHFDLINQRMGISYLRQWDWPKLLREYQRVCKRHGVIRITEGAPQLETSSSALTRLLELLAQAMYQAGYLFSPEGADLTRHLANLMHQHGIQQVQTKISKIAYHQTPATRQAYADDMKRVFQTTVPFMRKWIKLPPDYQDIYQQMLDETQQPDFEVTGTVTTAWGTVA